MASPTPSSQLADWWLDVACRCDPGRLVSLKVSGMVARVGPEAILGEVSARLKCVRCGERVSHVDLVDSLGRPPGM